MRFPTRRDCCLSFLLLMLAPLPALAMPAITCHCFTDRSYDPARPHLADPYFLATTQNSFFAAAFAVDKRTIVVRKQQGTSAADLWIAYWLAAKVASNPEALLQARKGRSSWRQVVVQLGLPARTLGRRFGEALQANAGDERLADTVVNELLLRFRFHGEAELASLRKAGAGNQELIIAGLIAARTEQPSLQLYLDVKKGTSSWGTLLDRAKISPAEIQKEMDARISRSR